MITYRSRFLKRAEVWYDEEPKDLRSLDWIHYNLRPRPVPGARWRYYHTYAIDLTQSAEQLRKRLSKETDYKIRRARDRDGVVRERCDAKDPAIMDQFEAFYNAFAASKNLSPVPRARIDALAASGCFDITLVKAADGQVLAMHGNYCLGRRVTGIYMPSLCHQSDDSVFRNLIGRANRLQTWTDILHYREQGYTIFDFGGWYPGDDNEVLLGINRFKRCFGGDVIREYECEQILSAKGWAVLQAAKYLKPQKKVPFPWRKPAEAMSLPSEDPETIAPASA